MPARPYRPVEKLSPSHNIASFDCGSVAQTEWLRKYALQSHAGRTSRVYVVRRTTDDVVVGYYALVAGSVQKAHAPIRVTQGAGGYDIPVIILARLAVDLTEQRQGLGRALLVDAFRRVEAIADQVGARALLIHAQDEAARGWYLRWARFETSPTDPLHLLLLIKDLRKALSG